MLVRGGPGIRLAEPRSCVELFSRGIRWFLGSCPLRLSGRHPGLKCTVANQLPRSQGDLPMIPLWTPPLLRSAGAGLLGLAACGCTGPQLPSAHVSEVARQANVAARFGRMDVASEYTAASNLEQFVRHRSAWGKALRVVDVELGRLSMLAPDEADVWLQVAWVRMNEGLLRSTEVRQRWRNPGGGWKLFEEQRETGDVGLLGENVVVLRPEHAPQRFPTQVIR